MEKTSCFYKTNGKNDNQSILQLYALEARQEKIDIFSGKNVSQYMVETM